MCTENLNTSQYTQSNFFACPRKRITVYLQIQCKIKLDTDLILFYLDIHDGSITRKRWGLKNVKLQGESASAGHRDVPGYIDDFSNIIEEGNFSPKQIFKCDETGLFCKRMPSRSYITEQERTYCFGFQGS